MYNKIKTFITKHNLINPNDTIIIGLSGGPDSVFLLHLLIQLQKEYNLKLIAAHLNHEWRAEADAEERMCKEIAQKYNIIFACAKISELSHPFKLNGSKEEYARKIRRFFLEKVLHEHNAQHIALGHHAQDQQETFFIRLIRGTSLTGLTGMKPKHGHYIRPLLETNKQDILAWLKERQIAYATDASNESLLFLRNRIRTKVLPALYECDKRFDANFLKTVTRLQEIEDFIEKEVEKIKNTIFESKNDVLYVNIRTLRNIDALLQQRIILHWLIDHKIPCTITEAFLDEILRFLLSERGGIHVIAPGLSIVKKYHEAYIKQT